MTPDRTTEIVIEPDPVIERYKKDVDRTLLWENLKLTYDGRARKLQDALETAMRLRGIAKRRQ